jgi:hypothetical protein
MYDDSWTTIELEGRREAAVANVLVSRLVAVNYEVQIEDAEGELVAFEDFELLNEEDEDGTEA